MLSQHEYSSARIVLLRPSMSFLLMQTRDPSTLREALPKFDRVSHVFLPINDNRNVAQAEGGSHWSLLLVSAADRRSFHYDSLASANRQEGKHASDKLGQLIGIDLEFHDLEDSPQQANSMDCGVFVCLNMMYLLKHRLLKYGKAETVSMSMGERHLDPRRGRKEILHTIEVFRKEGEKRRS